MSASFSACGTYRYELWRELGSLLESDGKGTCLFIMLNPSTADTTLNDPTISRCIKFARRWGYSFLAVGNLYAFRSSDPSVLRKATDPVGPDNDYYLGKLASEADLIVAAWGTNPSQSRVADVISCIDRDIHCLGVTNDGSPKHPLARGRHRIPDDTEPQPWRQSEIAV